MSETDADASVVKRHGWRQGSVVPDKIVAALQGANCLPKDIATGDILMVISHDCDVTREDYNSEPNVELLIVRAVEKPDGNALSQPSNNSRP